MALEPEQIDLYVDRFWGYAGGGKDARGNPSGPLVAIPELQGEDGTGIPCKLFTTDNFDDVSGPQGRAKVNNIFTTDVLDCEHVYPLRADMVVKAVQAGVETPQWFKSAGAPTLRPTANYQSLYLTTMPAPEGL